MDTLWAATSTTSKVRKEHQSYGKKFGMSKRRKKSNAATGMVWTKQVRVSLFMDPLLPEPAGGTYNTHLEFYLLQLAGR